MMESHLRGARCRGIFSFFALFSVVALCLLAVSVLDTIKQARSRFAATLEELQLEGIDLDEADEAAADFLKSKVRASAGDEYLYASSLPTGLILDTWILNTCAYLSTELG